MCEVVAEVLGAHCKITDRELAGVVNTLVPLKTHTASDTRVLP